jgi:hypothetical protein
MSPDVPSDVPVCGICGQLIDDRHQNADHGAVKAGRRIEYLVVRKLGGIAEFRESGIDSRVRKTDASVLAIQLGVEEENLPGCRFSCHVEPAEYGTIRSDFRLIEG